MDFSKIDLWILAFSAVTVVVTIWMGFRSAKSSKTASDFFVAGRSVSRRAGMPPPFPANTSAPPASWASPAW